MDFVKRPALLWKQFSHEIAIIGTIKTMTTKAQVRLSGCTGLSVPFLFECDDTSGFSHDVTHLESDDLIFVKTLAIEL